MSQNTWQGACSDRLWGVSDHGQWYRAWRCGFQHFLHFFLYISNNYNYYLLPHSRDNQESRKDTFTSARPTPISSKVVVNNRCHNTGDWWSPYTALLRRRIHVVYILATSSYRPYLGKGAWTKALTASYCLSSIAIAIIKVRNERAANIAALVCMYLLVLPGLLITNLALQFNRRPCLSKGTSFKCSRLR